MDAGRIQGFIPREPIRGPVRPSGGAGPPVQGDTVSLGASGVSAPLPGPDRTLGRAPLSSPHLDAAALEASSSQGTLSKRIIAGFFLGLTLIGVAGTASAQAPARDVSISTTVAAGNRQAASEVTKDTIIDSMLVRDTKMFAPSAASAQALKKTLSKVDIDVLGYAQQHGTRFLVVRAGQDLMRTGLIPEKQPDRVCEQAVAGGAAARGALGSVQRTYAAKLDAVKAQLAKLDALPEEMGGPGPSAALSRASDADAEKISGLYADLRGMQEQQKKDASSLVGEKTGGSVKLFSPAEGMSVEASSYEALERANTPQTPEQMAKLHGARTPVEVHQFAQAVEELNGGKLAEMRTQALERLEASVRRTGNPAEQRLLQQYRSDPSSIPLDHINNQVLVPDLYFYRPAGNPGGAPTVVDLYGYSTLNSWNDASGRIKSTVTRTGGNRGVMGQHFAMNGQNTIVIRDNSLGDRSAIHELGHALEELVKRESPQLSRELTAARDKAYNHISESEDSPYHPAVTDYAATSPAENLAEGFSLYYSDARLLNQKDPELRSVVEKEVNFARNAYRASRR